MVVPLARTFEVMLELNGNEYVLLKAVEPPLDASVPCVVMVLSWFVPWFESTLLSLCVSVCVQEIVLVPKDVVMDPEMLSCRDTEVVYVKVSLNPVEFFVTDWLTEMVGLAPLTVGAAPVVVLEEESSHTKILPVTCQFELTPVDNVAVVPPPSFSPTTLIVKLCDFPSQRTPNHGVMSISPSFKSKASIPTIGDQKEGTTPPVKMTGNGHCTPANCPSIST